MDTKKFTITKVRTKLFLASEFDDFRDAYEYSQELKKYFEQTNLKASSPELYGRLYEYYIRLRFIAFNMLSWDDVYELISKHIESSFRIRYYDLWRKIEILLIAEPDLDERNKIKKKILRLLEKCDRNIISRNKYKGRTDLPRTVAEWMNDFTKYFGAEKIQKIKKAQYLANSNNINKIDKKDKKKITILLNLFENLRLPSTTKDGFENTIFAKVGDKLFLFNKGQAEEIKPHIIKYLEDIRKKIGSEEAGLSSSIGNGPKQKTVKELQKMLTEYPEGSLERKAVEEEIKSLEHKT